MVFFDVSDVKSREKAVRLYDTEFDRTSLEGANGSRTFKAGWCLTTENTKNCST